MPREPPVISAIFPSSFLAMVFLLFLEISLFADPIAYGGRAVQRLESLPVETCPFSSVGRECSSEHGPLAYRLFFGRFILNDVPMLDKDPVLNAQNICGNPIHRSTETAKSPVHDREVSLSHDRSRFVLQRWGDALDEIEQTLTTRCDMSAVLNTVRRPETLSGCIVTFVEQRVEGF